MALRIEDYALIGNCQSAALVGTDESIDWLCWPRFDSPACFAALLGDASHGRWQISPRCPVKRTRRYRPDTLILETTLEGRQARARITNFMVRQGATQYLIRLVHGDSGRIDMGCEVALRFGYGALTPRLAVLDDGAIAATARDDRVVLRATVPLRVEGDRVLSEFTVAAGSIASFVLAYSESPDAQPAAIDPLLALEECESFWGRWAHEARVSSPFRDAIMRSLITVRALTYDPTGGIVASPTTSLPEKMGGTRNWDYRYCWLRDASFTLIAMMDAGYMKAAANWLKWLTRSIGDPATLQIMYGVAGERGLEEADVSWLPGYENSRPVRIGNDAYRQFQLDVYGELMNTLHHGRRGRLTRNDHSWEMQCQLLGQLENVWREPGHGIWEMRGPPQHFTYGKAMAWVAFDRGVRAVEEHGLKGPVNEWRRIRDTIYAEVMARGVTRDGRRFRISYDHDGLDAALLLLPRLGFISADDPRFAATVEAIEHDLMTDGFLRRYDMELDGLPAGQAAFIACTCWLADAYIALGRIREAEDVVKRVLSIRNDVGLLSEEYDTTLRRLVGNFPQGLSHAALVNTIFKLDAAREGRGQRVAELGHPSVVRPS